MKKIKPYKKWCLNIDNTEVNMPTKEHAIRIGKYLKSFNVPLKLVEVIVTVESDSGKVRIIDTSRNDLSQLLS